MALILAEKIGEAESAAKLKTLIETYQRLLEVNDKLEKIFAPLQLV